MADLLAALGVHPEGEGVRETPRRVAAAYAELLALGRSPVLIASSTACGSRSSSERAQAASRVGSARSTRRRPVAVDVRDVVEGKSSSTTLPSPSDAHDAVPLAPHALAGPRPPSDTPNVPITGSGGRLASSVKRRRAGARLGGRRPPSAWSARRGTARGQAADRPRRRLPRRPAARRPTRRARRVRRHSCRRAGTQRSRPPPGTVNAAGHMQSQHVNDGVASDSRLARRSAADPRLRNRSTTTAARAPPCRGRGCAWPR